MLIESIREKKRKESYYLTVVGFSKNPQENGDTVAAYDK